MNAADIVSALLDEADLHSPSEKQALRLTGKQDRAFQMARHHNPYPRMAGKAMRRFKKWSRAGQKGQDQMMKAMGTTNGPSSM